MILHNASICAVQPLWYEPIYNTTKAALMMFSKTLADEVVKDNIRVNCINPGLVLTPRLDQDGEAAHRRKGGDWQGYLQGVADEARRHQALRAPPRSSPTSSSSSAPTRRPIQRRLDLFRRWRLAEDGVGSGTDFFRAVIYDCGGDLTVEARQPMSGTASWANAADLTFAGEPREWLRP